MALSILTSNEQSELARLCDNLNIDQKTREDAVKFYLEYKNAIEHDPHDLLLCLSCALFISVKSQVNTTVGGETMRGIGVSFKQVIRALASIDKPKMIPDILKKLKEFLGVLTLEADLRNEIQAINDRYSFSFLMHIKFIGLFKEFQFADREGKTEENSDYIKTLRHFGWTLMLYLSKTILKKNNDLVLNCFLMLGIFYTLWANAPPSHIESQDFNNYLKEKGESSGRQAGDFPEGDLTDFLIHRMKMNNKAKAKGYIQTTQTFLQDLLKTGALRADSSIKACERPVLYSENVLAQNIKLLDALYLNSLDFDEIDERYFMAEKVVITPSKFVTPFTKFQSQEDTSSNDKNSNSKNWDEKIQFSSKLKDMVRSLKTAQRVKSKNKKNFSKTPFPAAGGASSKTNKSSSSLEMYEWLKECLKANNVSRTKSKLDEYLEQISSQFKEELTQSVVGTIEHVMRSLSMKESQMVQQLFFKSLESLLVMEEKKMGHSYFSGLLTNEKFLRSLVACCIEVITFISNKSGGNSQFNQLIKLCDIEAFDFWRLIGNFANFDKTMPDTIKTHFGDLERHIVLCLAWRSKSEVHNLLRKFLESKEESSSVMKELKFFDGKFFEKVLYHTANRIHKICGVLEIGKNESEIIWTIMRFVLSMKTHLLINRHVDQLIICSIYVAYKALNIMPMKKFSEILIGYQQVSDKIMPYDDVVRSVQLREENSTGDIIKFYNEVFVQEVKAYIKNLNDEAKVSSFLLAPRVPPLTVSSPLQESIKYRIAQSPTLNPGRSPYGMPGQSGMTPMTRKLFAFGETFESPQKSYDEYLRKYSEKKSMKSLFSGEGDSGVSSPDYQRKNASNPAQLPKSAISQIPFNISSSKLTALNNLTSPKEKKPEQSFTEALFQKDTPKKGETVKKTVILQPITVKATHVLKQPPAENLVEKPKSSTPEFKTEEK